ncbi:4'-phosphopantetheinyl transferase family protein [Labedaea rhizosphaerae]|uniref:4'-phosphopantetheinyl transferase n=1 Tax=Labedaea rhizosphaerae TaxID=598644 RepID=A0A4R6S084_LABRH|nr:4'-phosphopantetheinyl transferase superfamily protein [Labedaea rhizosphaerae]TDP92850.1 4'-phosphopantetheinyl transferase [Labedaea rhizosphaerae]
MTPGEPITLTCAPITAVVRRSTVDLRATARAALHDLQVAITGSASTVASTPEGRPYLPDRPDLGVSIAHDGDLVAAAVGVGVRVGIDVQVPTRAGAGMLRRCCPPATRVALAALDDEHRDHELARIWAVQEACVKAQGTGLAGRPWRIPVHIGQHDGRWHEHHWHSIDAGVGAPVSIAHGTHRERDPR